ncbi:MAG: PilZ domain-containing protein [Planctomycetota bacterium]
MFTGEEKRRAARIKFRLSDNLEVAYKFLSHLEEFQCDQIFHGAALNLSKGGALFVGAVPDRDWLRQLGQGLILIGLNVLVPESAPIKALSSLRWTRPNTFTDLGPKLGDGPHYEFGVQFEQISPPHQQVLEKFLIGHQLRTRKFKASDELRGGYR